MLILVAPQIDGPFIPYGVKDHQTSKYTDIDNDSCHLAFWTNRYASRKGAEKSMILQNHLEHISSRAVQNLLSAVIDAPMMTEMSDSESCIKRK
jgi:hypothetical protein